MYPEAWARFAALVTFVGFNLTFGPQFILGYLGMPRRYHAYGPNPWGAKGLEWETASPPPTFNFERTPTVTGPAYDYANEEKKEDNEEGGHVG
jgi:cytochrome c oxidase subunit 1